MIKGFLTGVLFVVVAVVFGALLNEWIEFVALRVDGPPWLRGLVVGSPVSVLIISLFTWLGAQND